MSQTSQPNAILSRVMMRIKKMLPSLKPSLSRTALKREVIRLDELSNLTLQELRTAETQLINLVKIMALESRSRFLINPSVSNIQVLSLNDTNKPNMAVRLYIPALESPEIGYSYITIKDGEYFIKELLVIPEQRRKKFGSLLLKETIQMIRSIDPAAIVRGEFDMKQETAKKMHLFEKFGFQFFNDPNDINNVRILLNMKNQ